MTIVVNARLFCSQEYTLQRKRRKRRGEGGKNTYRLPLMEPRTAGSYKNRSVTCANDKYILYIEHILRVRTVLNQFLYSPVAPFRATVHFELIFVLRKRISFTCNPVFNGVYYIQCVVYAVRVYPSVMFVATNRLLRGYIMVMTQDGSRTAIHGRKSNFQAIATRLPLHFGVTIDKDVLYRDRLKDTMHIMCMRVRQTKTFNVLRFLIL